MKKVVILSNHHVYTYNFRKEIIQKLIDEKYKVYVVLPYGEKVELLKEMGCEYIDLPLDRRGMNPITDFKLMLKYNKVIKKIKPNIVLSYTVKPNIYGGIVCRLNNIPFFPNVTGLGTAVDNESIIQKMIIQLYKVAYKKSACVFFQNYENKEFFFKRGFKFNNYRLVSGSGVNLDDYILKEYPEDDGIIKFLFIGRIMKDKGIEELVKAAIEIKSVYDNVEFEAIGFCEEEYKEKILELEELNVVKFNGVKKNVHEHIKRCNAVILPSYHEGRSNVLLESASTGRPILASNISGCKETFDEGISGFGFQAKNVDSLVQAIIKFIELPHAKKKEMGMAGRKKMEKEYDRNIVIEAYMEEINKLNEYKESEKRFI